MKRPLLLLLSLMLALVLAPMLVRFGIAAWPHIASLGWTGLSVGLLIGHIMLQGLTKRGLVHWTGMGLIAAGGAIDALPLFAKDAALELTERLLGGMRSRLREVGALEPEVRG